MKRDVVLAIFFMAVIALTLILGGCGGSSSDSSANSEGRTAVEFKIEWPEDGRIIHQRSDMIKIRALVNGKDIDIEDNVIPRPAGGGAMSGKVSLPSGPLTIIAEAYESIDPANAGKDPKNILSQAIIFKVLLPGSDTVSLVFGSMTDRINVAKNPDKLVYEIGDEIQLTATAINAAGAVILSGLNDFTYSSAQPSLASIDSTGKVKMLASGTGTLTVTESGVGGGKKSATLVVSTDSGGGTTGGGGGNMQDLGTLPGGVSSMAYGVSADGSVATGWATNAVHQVRAFRLTIAGGMQSLGTLGGNYSYGMAVSADGDVVVGGAHYGSGGEQYHAFRRTQAGGMQDLGTLVGGVSSMAYGVSADGSVVVGDSGNGTGIDAAFRWTQAGGMQDLGTLGGISSARGVSSDGSVVVGVSHITYFEGRAFRWTQLGGMQDLGTLGGDYSQAHGTTADGEIVIGWARNTIGQTHAFRWTQAGGMQDLGTLGGNSWANGVSSDGSVVVGISVNAFNQQRAFRWTQLGGMQDLGTLGGDYSQARGLSADGSVVVGESMNATGQTHAFRWTLAKL